MATKPHPPSPRKLQRAWTSGNIAISRTLVRATGLIVALLLIPDLIQVLSETTKDYIEQAPSVAALPFVPHRWILDFILMTGPLLLCCTIATSSMALFQSKATIAPRKLSPNLSRFAPTHTLRRLFSIECWISFLHTLLASAAILAITSALLRTHIGTLSHVMGNLHAASKLAQTLIEQLAWSIALGSLVLAAVDLGLTRYLWFRQQRMSDLESRQERRETEGDVAVRAARRQIHRQSLEERVPINPREITLLILDGTDWLFGLRYEPGYHDAPILVARARGSLAQRTALDCEAANVRVFTEPVIASMLRHLPLGESIPEAAFDHIATILAQLQTTP